MDKCKVIAVTNQKGGVSKTTTTVNLGVGLAQQGKKLLLVDADPQGSLTVSLGVKNPDELDTTISDLMQVVVDNGNLSLLDNGILKDIEGVDLVPSNIGLSSFEVSLVNTMSREFVLRSYLGAVKRNYDYILIDCMPSLGMLTINALAAADSVLIPCQANYLSTKGLKLLMGSVAKVRRQINPALKIDGILLTMVDNRTNNAKSIITALRQTGSNLRVLDTEIPFSVRAAECSVEGKSIFAHDGKGKVAAAYIAGEVVDTVTSGEGGIAVSKPLYLGKFEIREVTAPTGMVANKEVHAVELTYAGQEIEITETSANVLNERQKVAVTLEKAMGQNEAFGIGMNGEITAVTFGLYPTWVACHLWQGGSD